MKVGLSLIFIMTLLYLCNCSGSGSDQHSPTLQEKSSVPLQITIKPMGMGL
jgi:hypothetical protein